MSIVVHRIEMTLRNVSGNSPRDAKFKFACCKDDIQVVRGFERHARSNPGLLGRARNAGFWQERFCMKALPQELSLARRQRYTKSNNCRERRPVARKHLNVISTVLSG